MMHDQKTSKYNTGI